MSSHMFFLKTILLFYLIKNSNEDEIFEFRIDVVMSLNKTIKKIKNVTAHLTQFFYTDF